MIRPVNMDKALNNRDGEKDDVDSGARRNPLAMIKASRICKPCGVFRQK